MRFERSEGLSHRLIHVSTTVLYLYEYVTTVDEEVELFWNGHKTGATILFHLNRYLALFGYTYNLFVFIPMSDWVSSLAPSPCDWL